jgi:hypothetical protein
MAEQARRAWYTNTRRDALQGLVIEEETGRNVAVSYDPADAPLIAAAPDLLAAVESCLEWMEFTIPRLGTTPTGSIERMNWGGPIGRARDAIRKANEAALPALL